MQSENRAAIEEHFAVIKLAVVDVKAVLQISFHLHAVAEIFNDVEADSVVCTAASLLSKGVFTLLMFVKKACIDAAVKLNIGRLRSKSCASQNTKDCKVECSMLHGFPPLETVEVLELRVLHIGHLLLSAANAFTAASGACMAVSQKAGFAASAPQ